MVKCRFLRQTMWRCTILVLENLCQRRVHNFDLRKLMFIGRSRFTVAFRQEEEGTTQKRCRRVLLKRSAHIKPCLSVPFRPQTTHRTHSRLHHANSFDRDTTVTWWRIYIYCRWILFSLIHFKSLIKNSTFVCTPPFMVRCLQAESPVLWCEAAVYEVWTLPWRWKLGHIPLSHS